jgi:hypothetical protein
MKALVAGDPAGDVVEDLATAHGSVTLVMRPLRMPFHTLNVVG